MTSPPVFRPLGIQRATPVKELQECCLNSLEFTVTTTTINGQNCFLTWRDG